MRAEPDLGVPTGPQSELGLGNHCAPELGLEELGEPWRFWAPIDPSNPRSPLGIWRPISHHVHSLCSPVTYSLHKHRPQGRLRGRGVKVDRSPFISIWGKDRGTDPLWGSPPHPVPESFHSIPTHRSFPSLPLPPRSGKALGPVRAEPFPTSSPHRIPQAS